MTIASEPLRVGILCEYPTLNGGEHSMLAVLRILTGRNVHPTVIAPGLGPLAERVREMGLELFPLPECGALSVGTRDGELRTALEPWIERERPHLLHGNSLSMARRIGRMFGAERRSFALTAHLRDIMKLSRKAMADVNRNDLLVAVSEATRRFHIAGGMEADRVRTVHNGIAADEWFSESNRQPNATGDRTLLFVGQIGLRKGVDTLLEACLPLLENEHDLRLLLVGERNSTKDEAIAFEQTCRQAVDRSSAADRVHWLGRRDDVCSLMQSATLLVHPARQEPFGRVLLEAGAVGLPIVATDVGGTRELLGDEWETQIVPPDDAEALRRAIGHVLDNPQETRAVAERLRQRMTERFPIERAAEQLLDVWRTAVRRHARPG